MVYTLRRLLFLFSLGLMVCGRAVAGPADVARPEAREVMQAMAGRWAGQGQVRVVRGAEAVASEGFVSGLDLTWAKRGPYLQGSRATPGIGADGTIVGQQFDALQIAYDASAGKFTMVQHATSGRAIASTIWHGVPQRTANGVTIDWRVVAPPTRSGRSMGGEPYDQWRFIWVIQDGRLTWKQQLLDSTGQRVQLSASETKQPPPEESSPPPPEGRPSVSPSTGEGGLSPQKQSPESSRQPSPGARP